MMNTCTHMQRLLQQKYIVMSSGKRKTKTFTNVKKKVPRYSFFKH